MKGLQDVIFSAEAFKIKCTFGHIYYGNPYILNTKRCSRHFILVLIAQIMTAYIWLLSKLVQERLTSNISLNSKGTDVILEYSQATENHLITVFFHMLGW